MGADLGQDGPVGVEADHPGGEELTALHVHRADERQAGARAPGLHPHLQLLHRACRGQHKQPRRVHLPGPGGKGKRSEVKRVGTKDGDGRGLNNVLAWTRFSGVDR